MKDPFSLAFARQLPQQFFSNSVNTLRGVLSCVLNDGMTCSWSSHVLQYILPQSEQKIIPSPWKHPSHFSPYNWLEGFMFGFLKFSLNLKKYGISIISFPSFILAYQFLLCVYIISVSIVWFLCFHYFLNSFIQSSYHISKAFFIFPLSKDNTQIGIFL